MKEYFAEEVSSVYKNYTFTAEYLEYFKKTIKFCKDNNIRLWVYMSPMYSKHFDAIYAAGYFDKYAFYERRIVEITDFIDFTGHNTVSDNINNYWDSSHLREELTHIVIGKIFDDLSVKVPSDFGVMVTKENIEAHLMDLRTKIKKVNLNAILQDSKEDK